MAAHRLLIVFAAAATLIVASPAAAFAAFGLHESRNYMERGIQRALGRDVSKQFTTDNCNQPAKNSHFCLWNSPDRGIRVKVSGDVTAKARKVHGVCTVIVTGTYFVIDDETRGKLKYRTRGLPRFCR